MTSKSAKQIEEFKRVARELECDDDETRFNAALKKVAKDGAKKPEKPED